MANETLLDGRCEGCPFGKQKVVRQKLARARLMILGESPGAQEVRSGTPFVGPSGKLLWGTLKRYGIEREECAVTNALCCSAPQMQNKTSRLRPAVLACSSRLMEDIEAADPELILALGNTAVHALTKQFSSKITKVRGRVTSVWHEGLQRDIPVLPTLHPAAILRTPGEFRKLNSDLGYAARLLSGAGKKDPGNTRWKAIRTEEECDKAIALLSQQAVLAADIESSGTNPRECWIIAVGVSWEKNKTLIFPAQFVPKLKELLESPTITWVWHNGKFDTSFFQEQFQINARVDEDTMLMSYVLDETRGVHSLDYMSGEFLGAPDYSSVVKKYAGKGKHGWADIPISILYPYLAKDADYTLQLYNICRPAVRKDPELNNLYEQIILPMSQFLQRVEQTGVYASEEYITELTENLIDQKNVLEERIQRIADEKGMWDPDGYARDSGAATIPDRLNPASPKQLMWVLYSKLKLRPPRGFQPNTSVDTLKALPQTEFIQTLLEWRKVNKRLGTYCEGILREIEDDGRVHCTFLVHGTATGRLSSRGPNMQNIPRDKEIKAIFQAPPGRMLVECDLKGAELRMLAHLSQDPTLVEIFNSSDRNLHTEVAVELYGENFTKDQYVRAKAVNFGIPYGRTEYSFMSEFGMSFEEARKTIQQWFAQFPVAKTYLETEVSKPYKGGPLKSPLGRRRRYPLITDISKNEMENESRNFAIQSGASDLNILGAMLAETKLAELGAFVVNLVHDSIMIECPADQEIAVKCAREVQKGIHVAALRYFNSNVQFPVEANIGTVWGALEEVEV